MPIWSQRQRAPISMAALATVRRLGYGRRDLTGEPTENRDRRARRQSNADSSLRFVWPDENRNSQHGMMSAFRTEKMGAQR